MAKAIHNAILYIGASLNMPQFLIYSFPKKKNSAPQNINKNKLDKYAVLPKKQEHMLLEKLNLVYYL